MRQRSLTRRGLLAVAVVALGLAGCGGAGSGPAEEEADGIISTTTTTAPAPVAPSVIVAASEYGFEVPPEIEGGVVRMTFQNDGRLKHSALIVSAGDTPLDRVKEDLAPVLRGEGKPMPDYLHFQGGVSLVEGGTSWAATVSLPAGKYVMVCPLTDSDTLHATTGSPEPAGRPHLDLGMAVGFRVDRTNTAVMPPTDGTVVARDWSYEMPALVPGLKTLTFRNDGGQDHSLTVAEFPDRVDAPAAKAAFETVLAAPAGRPPPDGLPTPAQVAFAGPLSSGSQVTVSLRLKVNRTYVFACYLSDRAGGPLHATGKGMVAYATLPPG
jgi:hypothetical protein